MNTWQRLMMNSAIREGGETSWSSVMKYNPRRRAGAGMLSLVAMLVSYPITPALAENLANEPTRASFRPIQSATKPAFDTKGWTLQDKDQLALVGSAAGSADVFAGIQCDPFVPRAHRLIVGIVRRARPGVSLDLLNSRNSKLTISTDSPSILTEFELDLEDRGHSNFGGGSDFAAAYLNQQQFEAINRARAFTIQAGTRSFHFDGSGSTRAIRSLSCHGSEIHVASRLIEKRHEDMPAQKLASWRLALPDERSGTGSRRAEAYAFTYNHPVNPDLSFRLGVVCVGGQLFARFSAGKNPKQNTFDSAAGSLDYSKKFLNQNKLVDVYRGDRLLTTFMVDSYANQGLGHALSDNDIKSMMKSDTLTVVGYRTVIDFSTVNAAQSLEGISQFCGRTD